MTDREIEAEFARPFWHADRLAYYVGVFQQQLAALPHMSPARRADLEQRVRLMVRRLAAIQASSGEEQGGQL